jgi:hypothetical protein
MMMTIITTEKDQTTMPSPIAYIPGGFNPPTTGTPETSPINGMPNTGGFPSAGNLGQNSTLAGTNPQTQFNNNPIEMYKNMKFDTTTATLLASANGQLDPTAAAAATGLKPQVLITDPNGYTMAAGAGMSNQVLKIALDACINALQTDPATGQMKDQKGFMSLMAKMAKDPNALQDPRFQQLVPTYQTLLQQSGALANSVSVDPNTSNQLTQVNQQLNQLTQSNQAILATISNPENLSGSAADLARKIAQAMQSVPTVAPVSTQVATNTNTAATPGISSTQAQTQALFQNQLKSASNT